jgi:hypothetical protein
MVLLGRLPTVPLPNRKDAMTRLIRWISNVGDPYTEPEPHFHSGPDSTPAVCYDARCGVPRLDVGAG